MIHPTDPSLPSSSRATGLRRAPMVSPLSDALGHALRSPVLATPALSARTPPARRLQQRPAGWQCRPPVARSMAPATARAHRYRQGPRLAANGKGLALVELMLVVGTIMVVSGGIFAVYKVTDNKARAEREIRNAGEIADNLNRVMAAGANFGGLTQEYAISTHIFPDRMVDGNQVSTSWGGVLIEPTSVRGQDNQGARITYNNVPAEACATFVRGVANGFYEIRVNGQELRTNYTTIAPTALSNLCGSQDKATVELVYARNEGTGLAVDALTACTVPAPETDVSACPPGQAGTITRTRSFICESTYGPATPGPWSPPSSTCAPLCEPLLPTPNPEYANDNRTASRSTACPAGQVTPTGATSFTQTREEERTHSRTASCPAQTGPYTWSAWSPWTPWVAVSGPTGVWDPANGCAPKCELPSPSVETEVQTQDVQTTASCPAGQLGLITYTHEERRTRSRTASCPAPTGAYQWGTPTAWTTWSPSPGPAGQPSLVSNTCAPKCVAPAPVTTTESQSAVCGTGRVTPAGATTFTQTRTKTISYSCPAPTGSYTANPATYSAWSPSEATACAPKCVAPPPFVETAAGTPQTLVTPYSQPAPAVITTTPQSQAGTPETLVTPYSQPAPAVITTTTQTQPGTPQTLVTPYSQAAPAVITTTTQTRAGTPQTLVTPYSQSAPAVVTTTPQTQPGDQQAAAGTPNTRSPACPAGQSGTWTQTQTTTRYRSTTEHRTRTNTQPMIQERTGTQTRTTTQTRTRTNTQPMIQERTGTQTRTTTQTRTQTKTQPMIQERTGTQTRSTTIQRTTTYTCASPTGPATASTSGWSAPGAPYGAYGAPTYTPWTPTPNGPAVYTYTPWSAPGAPYGAYSTPVYTPWSPATPNGPVTYTYSPWSAPGAPYGPYSSPVYSPWSSPTPNGPVTYTYTPYSPPGAPYGPYSSPVYSPWSSPTPNGPVQYSYSPWGAPTSPYGNYGPPGAPLGPWTTTTNTCAPTGCVVPSGTTRSWTAPPAGGRTCSVTTTATTTIANGAYLTLNENQALPLGTLTGTAKFLCSNGTLSTTAASGQTCVFTRDVIDPCLSGGMLSDGQQGIIMPPPCIPR